MNAKVGVRFNIGSLLDHNITLIGCLLIACTTKPPQPSSVVHKSEFLGEKTCRLCLFCSFPEYFGQVLEPIIHSFGNFGVKTITWHTLTRYTITQYAIMRYTLNMTTISD